MGDVEVPVEALWGAQTQRAVENFPVSGERIGRDMIGALGCIKGVAARINGELGVLDADMADAIHDAAASVARGEHDDQFPVDVFQTGSGTSSNMNANEVIAGLASRSLGRKVHPNDHVNASQSSNDVFPSAIHLAAVRLFALELIPALKHLASVLTVKAEEFAGVCDALGVARRQIAWTDDDRAASAGTGVVISTRPGPAGGMNASTDARLVALSNTSSHGASARASTP